MIDKRNRERLIDDRDKEVNNTYEEKVVIIVLLGVAYATKHYNFQLNILSI